YAAWKRYWCERSQKTGLREADEYRLNVVRLVVPPLRARAEDIRLLFEHFLRLMAEQYKLPQCRMSEEAYAQLEAYHWPGNIRELKNIAERVAVRCSGQLLTTLPLPAPQARKAAPALQPGVEPSVALAQMIADDLYERMTAHGESFWTIVCAPFMARDITRETVRAIVRRGLECTRGNYRLLAPLFNFPVTDYKRFLNFLDKHDCHVPFQHFRLINRSPARAEHAETAGTKVG